MSEGIFITVLVVLLGLMAWAIIEDGREMDRKKVAFYQSCLAHRQTYDCDIQWQTFKAAHDAEQQASMAVVMSSASLAQGK